MQIVYDKALEKHNKGEFQDMSNLAYTMTPETGQQWVEGKTKYLESLNGKLHAIFNKDEILEHITNLLDQCVAKGGLCDKMYMQKETFVKEMKEAISPQISRHFKNAIGNIITEVVKEFVKFMKEFMKFQAGNAKEKAGGLEVNEDFELQIGDLTLQIMGGAALGSIAGLVAIEMAMGGVLTCGLLTAGGLAVSSMSWTKKGAIDEMAKQISNEICDVAKYKMIYDTQQLFEKIIEEQEKLNNFR